MRYKFANHWGFCLFFLLLFLMSFSGCIRQEKREITPWGTPVNEDSLPKSKSFTLLDIVNNGELIMLTMNGPETYYDYRGHGMGMQYLLCEKFAQKLGVKLRVEVCKDTADMVKRLRAGEGDIIAFPLPKQFKDILYCGFSTDSLRKQWAVQDSNHELADTLNRWFHSDLVAEVKEEESFILSSKSVTRRVFSPMLNRSGGVISRYDALFQKYASVARWDWRLLAAQCYQESTFDPHAKSWVGACGLMQIMPATAAHLGLPMSRVYEPEANIAAAAQYIHELNGHFSDIQNRTERYYFILAAYNGGFFHIRDAMTLAKKHGKNPYKWDDVAEFVLKLSSPDYYNDPVVKHGYMRGSETVNYVASIRNRWAQYRGFARGSGFPSGITGVPRRARHHNKYKITP